MTDIQARPLNRAVYERLIDAARQQEPVTYGQVGDLLGLAMDYPPHREEMAQALGAISRHEVAHGRPMLSSLVTLKDGSGPGKGFYRLGRELGQVLPDEDELGFSVRQLKETFAFWSDESAPTLEQALGTARPTRWTEPTDLPAAEADLPPVEADAPALTPDLPAVEGAAVEEAPVAAIDIGGIEVVPAEPADVVTPLAGNKAVEDAAIRWVIQLEQAAGRQPVDRRYESGFAADIESPPRTIEVKAVGGSTRGWFLPLEVKQFDRAQRDPNFYIYVVENTRQGDPTLFTLKILGGKQLHQLLARAKERRYYEVPWPVAHYDKAPGMEALAEGRPAAPAGKPAAAEGKPAAAEGKPAAADGPQQPKAPRSGR